MHIDLISGGDESAEPPSCARPCNSLNTVKNPGLTVYHRNPDTAFDSPFALCSRMQQPARQPSFHLLAGLARIALLQGQFDRARTMTSSLDTFAAQFENVSAKSLALTFMGLLAVIADDDPAQAQRLLEESQTLVLPPQGQGLAQRGLALAAWVQSRYDIARVCFARALQVNSGGYGVVDVLLAGLLETSDHPENAVEYLSLSWHHALPDGGWLTHSPLFRRAALDLMQRCGEDVYREHWLAGQQRSLRVTLDSIMARYTGT